MDEVGTAILAISLVLTAVFVPTAFIPGISGQFYQQFAVTIAASTIISAINSLTLSPALAAALLKPHDAHASAQSPGPWRPLVRRRLQPGFDRMSSAYAGSVRAVRRKVIMLADLCRPSRPTVYGQQTVPRGFIPQLDQGYAIVVIQLPDGSSLSRTDAVVQKASKIMQDTPGIVDAVAFAGFSGATFTNASNQAAIFARFATVRGTAGPWPVRHRADRGARRAPSTIEEAFIIAMPPPPVRGIGNAGGFKIELQERVDASMLRVLAAACEMMAKARTTPQLTGVFTTFSASSPQIYLEIDRTKARMLDVPIANIFEALQVNLGTSYVNDFNAFGRVYQVRAQADQKFRLERQDVLRLKVRSATARWCRSAPWSRSATSPAPTSFSATTCTPPCRCRGTPRQAILRPLPSMPWRRLPARCCRRARASNGRSLPSRSARPAISPSSSSRFRSCSSSWCSPRNMRAGRCRSPSS